MTTATTDSTAFAALLERVDRNGEVMRSIEDLVDRRVRQGRLDSAAAWVRVGASFCSTNPTSDFRAVRSERALDEISRRALGDGDGGERSATVERVLHVLSEAHLVGGHRSMALRWVHLDVERASSFVVTRPDSDTPALHDAAATRNGEVHVLGGSLLERSAQLRELASDFDMVVCHTHNDDTVPAMAFGGSYRGAPVVLVNHADHVFYLGVGNVSTIANLRWTGGDFAERARGFPASSFCHLPIPVDQVERGRSRAEAKRLLGIDPSTAVALTLARAKKFLPSPLHSGFVEIVGPAVESCDVTLVAVGPSAADPGWGALAERLGDRVRVEGLQSEPRLYLDAADIYLDSIPFSSNTSMLEAAYRGTPILASRQYSEFQRLHGSDGVLDEVVVAAADAADYASKLRRLVDDPSHREALGAATFLAVRNGHGLEAWRDAMERVYDHALAAEPVTDRRGSSPADHDAVRDYAAALLGIESATPLLWSVMTARVSMDVADRRSTAVRTAALRAWHRLRPAADCSGPAGAEFLVPRR